MNAQPNIDILEATRLTREGRLAEAMAILQGGLPSGRPSALSGNAGGNEGQRCGRPAARIVNMMPPSSGGGAWTSPKFNVPHMAPGGSAGGLGQPQMPEALRGFLDRTGQPGSLAGFDGLVGPVPARAPIPLPEGARFEERTFANEAGSRTYKLYIPSGYTGQPVPLVVMLHGCTQSPDDFAAGTRMNELAEEQTFLVAYPAQAQSANVSKCWNWFNAADQQRDRGEPSLIAGITRQIMHDFSVKPGQVYAAGLSAGGAAAAIMGSAYPDLYAAVGVHSGLACGAARDMPSAFAAMRQGGAPQHSGAEQPVPTIVFHGDRDTTVSPINGDQVIAQSKAGSDFQTTVSRGQAPGGINYTRTVACDDSGHPMLEHWVLHGAGHAWSGGSPSGSYTEPKGPDASREMMRFFLEHPKPRAASPN
ncbi:PHB depolymerase family esterase [Microvirga sp. 3-52]|jgi:poly(hydroxyalkanoate) depolymerase family esterase|uniref:extracellular catalytic domain type 1 short-chain-length polyhydroxyalkanoate depolymerase n=1 Tax=Microvirga sp. 3-52 TaxID=2792425 RepID=UPI001AC8A166|nr:PHB depolymerase family esterase [Microvirga sp. 3-52]MBO1907960.1 PHB depolymerase family esterase [Microvirga sp. 3-52]MBS7454788.1 PHB depolymerase family esterase [Microvirga sp. 3-52]